MEVSKLYPRGSTRRWFTR